MLMAILKIMVCANAIYNFSFNLNALKDADKNSGGLYWLSHSMHWKCYNCCSNYFGMLERMKN